MRKLFVSALLIGSCIPAIADGLSYNLFDDYNTWKTTVKKMQIVDPSITVFWQAFNGGTKVITTFQAQAASAANGNVVKFSGMSQPVSFTTDFPAAVQVNATSLFDINHQ